MELSISAVGGKKNQIVEDAFLEAFSICCLW